MVEITSIDWTWVTIWFCIGLYSFFVPKMIPGVKGALVIFSAILLINLILRTNAFESGRILVDDFLTSAASSLAYLFSANISRSVVMGVPLSFKIIIYGGALIWLILNFG